MRLTGRQYQQFMEALLDAYSHQRLREMLKFRLDKNLDVIALGDDLQAIVFKVIGRAETEGWTSDLLIAARESNPDNAALLAFAQQFGLATPAPARSALERMIQENKGFLDVAKWRTCLGEIEAQICRLEIRTPKGVVFGTGFLLGPDVVITNYHVMKDVIDSSVSPENVVLRFGYKRSDDGTTLHPGVEFRLANDWCIDWSPWSPVDEQPEPKTDTPAPDQLDYAVIRVAGAPGDNPIGDHAEPGAPARKWIDVPANGAIPSSDASLLILQHPQGDPLKLALDGDVIGMNENGTRLMYTTNTLGGSSGSPCFDIDWNLVALHHSGDPNFDPAHKPAYNQGIPIGAIVKLLEERKKRDLLGAQDL